MITLKLTQGMKTYKVHLDDAIVSGDPQAVKDVVQGLEFGQVCVPGLPMITGNDILYNSTYFFMYCKQLYDKVEVVEGKLDAIFDVPDGAIP